MAKNKTTQTELSVKDFIEQIGDPVQKQDSFALAEMMQQESGFEAKMWGSAIVGFGSYHYKYDSGHQGDAPLVAFSPRSAAISLYLAIDVDTKAELLAQLGKHKTGKGCVYVKKLADVDAGVLRKMIRQSLDYMKQKYPAHS